MPSLMSCRTLRIAAKFMAGVQMLMYFWEAFYQQKITQLRGYDKDRDNDANGGNDDEREINNVVEEEDGEHICFLGGNSSSGTKKYRGSNSNDGGNTGDGVKIAGEVIGSGDEIGKVDIANDSKQPRHAN
ncbi:hypothetical protein Tco_0040519 [Tanacetum coccineum]